MKSISFEYWLENKSKLITKDPKFKNNSEVYIGSIKYTIVKPIEYTIERGWKYQICNTYTEIYDYADESQLTKHIFTEL
jgi:hypothetical protein|tara:strand:- start:177 stop:413 length:237 start_codon:yes stop_codon:yes gene_type:complete